MTRFPTLSVRILPKSRSQQRTLLRHHYNFLAYLSHLTYSAHAQKTYGNISSTAGPIWLKLAVWDLLLCLWYLASEILDMLHIPIKVKKWHKVTQIYDITNYAYKVRKLVRCIRYCVAVLLPFCGLQNPQKRNDAAMVCLRWHGTGPNSTDAFVLSLLDSLRIQTSDFHLSPHNNIWVRTEIWKGKATLKSFDKQYIKSIWTIACNEHDSTY